MTDDLTAGVEIRALVEAYAQAADDADGPRIAELFLTDGVMTIHRDPSDPGLSAQRSGREEIAQAMEGLKRYVSTAHVIANHTSSVAGDTATAVTRCLAHHLMGEAKSRRDLVMHIRYDDVLRHTPSGWRFEQRHIHVLALDDRPAPDLSG